jgi:hypothetical protein
LFVRFFVPCVPFARSRIRTFFKFPHPGFSRSPMPRFSFPLAFLLAFSFLLSACVGDQDHQNKPPQDPPDYKGVPTDDRPPVMTIAPAKPDQPQ